MTESLLKPDFNFELSLGEQELQYIEKAESEIKRIGSEIQDLQLIKKILTNNIAKVKDSFKKEMVSIGLVEETYGNYFLKLSKSKPSVVLDCEPSALPEKYQKVEIKPNKVLLYEDLKAGNNISDCKLQQNNTLTIKYLDNSAT